ncbi:MAG: hypothetical protein IPM98_14215 [Lewinellaceae bacterium]|nr:hypothetical protein [Lewinellaceae bacterium]
MKRLFLSALVFLAIHGLAGAQAISINTDGSNPDTSAILDVKSTDKGILIPRMDFMQRMAIAFPASGLIVYEIGNGATANAFWYNAGTPTAPDWQRVGLRATGLNCNPANPNVVTTVAEDCDQDTQVETDYLLQNPDIIRMTLGDYNSGTTNPTQVLVLRHNSATNPNSNTMLEIFDPTGNANLFIGEKAGNANTTGMSNVAVGLRALELNTTGNFNTAIGVTALAKSNADNNVAIGNSALSSNTSGFDNTATGVSALFNNIDGANNTANGAYALSANTHGSRNTASGSAALYSNVTSDDNAANGYAALYNNTGANNTASGSAALYNNTTGNNNTAIGSIALFFNTIGTNNSALGYGADVTAINLTNTSAIGANAKVTASNSMILGDNNVRVGIGLSNLPGPNNKLEINATAPDASGLRFRRLTSASPASASLPLDAGSQGAEC